LFYGSKIKKYNVKNNRPHMCPVFSPAACSNSQASSSQAQQFLEALSSYPPHRTHAWVSSAWNTQSSLFPHLISIQLSDLTEMVPFHKGLLLSIPHEMFSSFFIFYLFYFFFFRGTGDSGLHTYKAGALPLEPHLQSFFFQVLR
jgi:hypothetical protein